MAEPVPKLVDVRAVSLIVGVVPRTIWRWANTDPTFPTPVRLSRRVVRFRLDAVHAWLAARERPPAN